MQKPIITLIALLISLCANAAEDLDAVRIWNRDGSSDVFLLSSKPKVTFTEQELFLTTADITLSYPLSSCAKFTFEKYTDKPQAVSDTELPDVVFWLTERGFAVIGLEPDSPVTVLDIHGRIVLNVKADRNGSLEAGDFASSGAYIVKTKSSTFKMIRK